MRLGFQSIASVAGSRKAIIKGKRRITSQPLTKVSITVHYDSTSVAYPVYSRSLPSGKIGERSRVQQRKQGTSARRLGQLNQTKNVRDQGLNLGSKYEKIKAVGKFRNMCTLNSSITTFPRTLEVCECKTSKNQATFCCWRLI